MSISSSTLGLFNRLPVRVFVSALVVLPFALVITYVLSPKIVSFCADNLVHEVALEIGGRAPSNFQSLKIITQHDLAWCYVTDGSGHVLPVTRPFAPNLNEYAEQSRVQQVRETRYYEAVTPIDDGQMLHVGIPLHPSWETFLLTPQALFVYLLNPLRVSSVAIILLIEAVALVVVTQLGILWPLSRIGKSLKKLAGSDKVKQLDTVLGASDEINRFVDTLNDVFIQDSRAARARHSDDDSAERVSPARPTRETQVKKPAAQQALSVSQANPAHHDGDPSRGVKHELSSAPSTKAFARQLLEALTERFPDIIDQLVFFKLDRDYHATIDASLGLDPKSILLLEEVDHREVIKEHFAAAKSADIGPMFIRRLGFEPLANRNNIRRVLYFIIRHGNQDLAAFVIFLPDEDQVGAEQMRVIERFRDEISSFYHKLLRIEAAEDADWTDHLTGLRNRQFFNEVIESAAQGKFKTPYSVMVISGDFQDPKLKLYEAEVRDRWLQELARILRNYLDVKERIDETSQPGCFLVRYQGDEFAVLLEETDVKDVIDKAEKIRRAVEATDQWAGGVKKVTISGGCATVLVNGGQPEEVVAKARQALQFTNDQLGSNQICHASNVPEDYTPSKRGSAFSGELGVLDCSGLLQSIARSQKTGLLSVHDETGRQLLVSWETGTPKQAKLGEYVGLQAVIEFVVTFESGTFTFEQRAKTTIDGAGGDVPVSLEKMLMEGALAEDHVRLARRIIPDMRVLVRAVPGIDTAYRWLKLQQDRETSQDELSAMKELITLANGSRSLEQCFEEMKFVPSYLKWRAAFLLVENRLLQVKKQQQQARQAPAQ